MWDISNQEELKNIQVGESYLNYYLFCNKAELKTTKLNTVYWDLTISDNSIASPINAKMFDASGKEDVKPNSIVKVSFSVEIYQNNKQLRVSNIKSFDINGCNDLHKNQILQRCLPCENINADNAMAFIWSRINGWQDKELTAIATAVINNIGEEIYKTSAAGRAMHHYRRNGLLLHCYTMLRAAISLCDIYTMANKELVECGVLLHDCGKVMADYSEFSLNDFMLVEEYSSAGNALGHLCSGVMLVHQKGIELNINKHKLLQLEHIIASHHGDRAYGALQLPATIEAMIVSMLDMLDAQLYQANEAINNTEPGKFSDNIIRGLDRRVWNVKENQIEQENS